MGKVVQHSRLAEMQDRRQSRRKQKDATSDFAKSRWGRKVIRRVPRHKK